MSRILDTILPESVHNEGLLFVPQVLEDLMRGKLDAEFPPKLDEGDDPASVRAFVFDRAKRLYASFMESSAQTNVDAVTRKFVVNLLDNALGWDFDKAAAVAEKAGAFLVSPVLCGGEDASTPIAFPIILAPHAIGLDESNPRFHGWGLSDASRSATRFAQEFLNERDDFLWAIVTNGKELRLVRDNPSLTRPSFLSFDLGAILSGPGDFPAFAFLWRMLHASRAEGVSAENSVWEISRRATLRPKSVSCISPCVSLGIRFSDFQYCCELRITLRSPPRPARFTPMESLMSLERLRNS